MIKVVFVVGPTASGKSDLALKLARDNQGAIINCDSVQLYKSLDIGSAKPSAADFASVPHYLFDVVNQGEEATAGRYQRDFFETMKRIENQYRYAFVVGGTGFYFQAIEKGMYQIGAADEKVRAMVEEELSREQGPEKLYQELVAADPVTAAKISPNDHYRISRAIEMMRTHGRPVSEIKKEFLEQAEPFPYPLLKLGIRGSREELTPRVRLRTQKMLQAGLLDEVKALLAKGLKDWSPLQSVGYKECLEYFSGSLPDLQSLEGKIVQNTLRLAKRQRTWFQRDTEIHWLTAGDVTSAQDLLNQFSTNP
jgi:tRNA dimethylallyltransferase